MEIISFFPSWLSTIQVLLILCIFLYTLKSKNTSNYKLPPNPPKLPIIGNLHQLIGKPRHEALWKLSKQYGHIMQIYIGSKPFLVISSPSSAKQILRTQDHIFCSRPKNYASKRMTYNFLDIAFSPESDRRRDMRKLLVSEFLGPKKARLLNHVLEMETKNMVHSLTLHPSNTVVDLSKVILATVTGVVCRAGFGINYKQEPIKGSSLGGTLEETVEVLNGSLVDSFPWFGRIFDHFSGWNSRLEKCFSDLDAYIEMVIDQHHSRNTISEVSDHDKDFLHKILELSSIQNAFDYRLSKEDVKAHITDVLIGGVDTTVVTTVWAMSEIVRNTRVMKKLQNEIRNCTDKKEMAHELGITKMRYLKMVVKETLRLHPPAPLLIPHQSLSHTQIGGYDVFPDTTVLINGWGIGRDPNTWGENAAEFYPDRFENLDIEMGSGNCEFIPFGAGRRACPAKNSVPQTVESVIANLVYWFDWEVPEGMKNEDLNMEDEGTLVIRKKLPLCVVPTKLYNRRDL